MALSASALSFLYPQVPIEDKQDVELLWSDELEHKTLLKKKYINDFTTFNAKHGRNEKESYLKELQKQTYYKDLKTHYLMERFDTFDAISGETVFYETFPEWFGYLVLGRKFLAAQSKSRKFSFFMDFQVDYMRTFMDPTVIRMGKVTNRGGAKSWLDMFCSVMDCTIHPWNEISIMGGSAKQSVGAYDYARAMVEAGDCGVHHLVNQKEVVNDHIHFKPRNLFGQLDDNGYTAKIFNQASAETSTRGPRASKIIFDEVTQTKEDVIVSAIGQAITSPDIKIIWGGTPDDPGHIAHTDWWCNPPDNIQAFEYDEKGVKKIIKKTCHHWIYYYEPDPELSWNLFHWDAFSCHVDKGGWITDKAIRALLATYKSNSKRRREIYGLWTAEEGNILKTGDIEAAMRGFNVHDLPLQLSDYDGFVVAVDGARHRHYSTIVIIGFKNLTAYVLYAHGWDEIEEPKMRQYVMSAVSDLKSKGALNIRVVMEDAPVSTTLIDNTKRECREQNIRFSTSTFKHNKLGFVDHMVEYFETHKIKLPEQFISLVNELYDYRWGKNVDTKGRKLPEKEGDDFIDALMHALMSDYLVYTNKKKGDAIDKSYHGTSRPEKALADKMVLLSKKRYARQVDADAMRGFKRILG